MSEDAFELVAGFASRGNQSRHAQSMSYARESQDRQQLPHARRIGNQRFKMPLARGVHQFSTSAENSLNIPLQQSQRCPVGLPMSRSRFSANARILNGAEFAIIEETTEISIKEGFGFRSAGRYDPQFV